MNPITDIWRQLVRRRLWPVAIVLVAALAAVPVLLAKTPDPVVPAPAPTAAASDDGGVLATEPIVAAAAAADPDADRRPLGKRHDIFKPTKKPVKVKAAKDEQSDKAAETKPSSDAKPADPKPSGGGSTTPSETPAEPVQPEAPKTYPLYSLSVRFAVSDDAKKRNLPRRSALPSASEPLIVYLGLDDDHKTAVFLLDSTVQAVGDGDCDPSPESCETVRMKVGDTMFFDVVDAEGHAVGDQFQLDLLKINKKQTTDAASSARSASLARVSRTSSLRARTTAGLARVG